MSEEIKIEELNPTTTPTTIEKVESTGNWFINLIKKLSENIYYDYKELTEDELENFENKLIKLYEKLPTWGYTITKKDTINLTTGIGKLGTTLKNLFKHEGKEIQFLLDNLSDDLKEKFLHLLNISYITEVVNLVNEDLRDLSKFKTIIQDDVGKIHYDSITKMKINLVTKIKTSLNISNTQVVLDSINKSNESIIIKLLENIKNEKLKNIISKFFNMILSTSSKFDKILHDLGIIQIFPDLFEIGGLTFFIIVIIEELIRDEIFFDYLINNFFGVDVNSEIVKEFKSLVNDFITKFNIKNEPIKKIDSPIKKNERQI
jgi:hypothetical protein